MHFQRHHNGAPDIDSAKHELLIHGLVQRPLTFRMAALSRYPMVSHVYFIEYAGLPAGSAGIAQGVKVYAAECAAYHGEKGTGKPADALSNEEVHVVSVYVLFLNGIIGDNQVMNAQTLPAVKMPNRDGFVDDSRK